MENNIKKLEIEFKRIKSLGYVQSKRKGSTGIGKTFEYLLGKDDDRLSLPDFNNIEIKTKRHYTNSYITLFSITPKNNMNLDTIRYIVNRFGYPDKDLSQYNVLNNEIYCGRVNHIGTKYLFSLSVDYSLEKVGLKITNLAFNDELGDTSFYWSFEEIRSKLESKTPYIAIVYALRKYCGGIEYFKYYKVEVYKLKSFNKFIDALSNGFIRIKFKIGIFKSGERLGEIHDHGTSFEIDSSNFCELYEHVASFY